MAHYKRFAVAMVVMVLLAVALPSAVLAQSKGATHVTHGDAKAVFNAFINGGFAIRLNNGAGMGAPADGLVGRATIRPFDAFDGAHYCVDDWHVIVFAVFDGGDSSFSRKDALPNLDGIINTISLDGVSLELQRTPVKPFLNPEPFGFENAYGFQEGRIMSPDELSVGSHTLGVVSLNGITDPFENTIEFHVDPADSATCSG